VVEQVRRERAAAVQRAAGLDAALSGRLWLPPSLAARWQAAHARSEAVLGSLEQRLGLARAGYAALPIDPQLPAIVPAPVALEA
jgi:hypothetical protein